MPICATHPVPPAHRYPSKLCTAQYARKSTRAARRLHRAALRSLLAGLAFAHGGCGLSFERNLSDTGGSQLEAGPRTAGAPAPAPAAELPADFVGVFHLVDPGKVDVYNLRIHERGAFVWEVNGCDFFGGDKGRVEASASGVTLLPAQGAKVFKWVPDHGVGSQAATRVTIEVAAAGKLTVTSTARPQTWTRGALCPICGATSGPTAAARACADPDSLDL